MSSKIEVSRELAETLVYLHETDQYMDIDIAKLRAILAAPVVERQEDERVEIDRPWSAYKIGTKAISITGGHWTKTDRGWKWHCGSTFPTPGADARWVVFPNDSLPELAELQATIDQQAALIHWMKGLLWSGGRPRADEEEYEQMTDYDKGLLHGGIELWDQLDCRLRAKIKEIDLLSSGVASHG